ncbi:MAG: PfaD family polyunsaturated fatty acid/polyketide biosynthesis protein [Candidatus Ozemobacteraceae bacterium]
MPLEALGDKGFCTDYGLRYSYVGGSMAHGISSPELAEALGRNGMLGFIGTAGKSPDFVEAAIERMQAISPKIPFGFNLIHSPNEPALEDALCRLYLKRGVRLIEASAFLAMTLPLIRYRVHGIHRGPDGAIIAPNRVMAKASRVEVASKFFAPPPEKMLSELVSKGEITEEQARLAAQIPVAQDMTAEADSGGHTDNRPAVSLLPTFLALRDRMQTQYGYAMPLRVGLGGGIATPASAAAAFAMGAAWIVVGSVHQSCIESGVSPAARDMLAQAGQADTAMCPAGDMFEMGVTVQVLKRGTMFPMRASKLYELYRAYSGLNEIPATERANLEKNLFKDTLENIWAQTREFFSRRDPAQVERAERDPKHLMALVFRWYLGQSPRWAVAGDPARRVDYQIWCGPAMGAFNEWIKGSFLEPPAARTAKAAALNLLFGASVVLRQQTLRSQGAILPPEVLATPPLTPDAIFSAIR